VALPIFQSETTIDVKNILKEVRKLKSGAITRKGCKRSILSLGQRRKTKLLSVLRQPIKLDFITSSEKKSFMQVTEVGVGVSGY
jgi:hypothetical protein